MNGHDFTLEQNTEARMMLAVARRGLAAAINDAENGIGHLSCDDPKIMEQVRAHHRPDRPRRPPRRHHQTEMGLSNGLCSNHVGRSQSSRTHSSGAAAQIERPEVRTIACGHRVHDRVLGAGFVAVVPRPIRFGRIFLMDLSNRAVRPQASVVGRKSIA